LDSCFPVCAGLGITRWFGTYEENGRYVEITRNIINKLKRRVWI